MVWIQTLIGMIRTRLCGARVRMLSTNITKLSCGRWGHEKYEAAVTQGYNGSRFEEYLAANEAAVGSDVGIAILRMLQQLLVLKLD